MNIERRQRRAAWVMEFVIPHECRVRAWLAGARVAQEDIDELIQESYARLAALDSVAQIDRPDAYFFSIARNLLVRRLRRANIVPIETIAEIDAYSDEASPSPERDAGGRIEWQRLKELLDSLPERRRRIVSMRKLEGYSQREIAAELGVSESVVENEVFKGVQAIRNAWREDSERAAMRLATFEAGEWRA